ncbi:predicted protein [Botrytis cinerea T4]|uniref:Uncharacterized protein n=1 Tax=Botryotinia fuckeliana (strain T4) TaxID=999810 RepID=G2XVS6_BOTF4|nr:predicted protein [Botrytis cinerea T4]
MTPEGMMGEFVTGLCNDHCGTAYNQSEPNVLHYDVLISPTDANAILPEVITSKVESNAIKPEVSASKSASQEDHENKSDENKNKKHTIRFEVDDIIEFKGTEEETCTTEGMFNCISGTSFQQCASGGWSAVQNMAEGTSKRERRRPRTSRIPLQMKWRSRKSKSLLKRECGSKFFTGILANPHRQSNFLQRRRKYRKSQQK